MASVEVTPIINESVRSLCTKPYPGHPKGCPNYGTKYGCPPAAPIISETLDLEKPVYAVYHVFDLGRHVERMRAKHPDWSQRQLKCCLYWQQGARKELLAKVADFMWQLEEAYPTVITCPEAQGVDVTATMHNAGIDLEWPPEMVTYQIMLVGARKAR